MSDRVAVEISDMENIADAIRDMTGENTPMGVKQMPEKIMSIGGGMVTSVNGQTGDVSITAESLGAVTADSVNEVISQELEKEKASGVFDGRSIYACKGDELVEWAEVGALTPGDSFLVAENSTKDPEVLAGYAYYVTSPTTYEKKGMAALRGEMGEPALIEIHGDEFVVSYDKGATWISLGIKKDGVTPLFRINNNYVWEVSVDNGNTWNSMGKTSRGEKGDKGDKGDNGGMPKISFRYEEETGNLYVTVDDPDLADEVSY